MPRDFEKDYQWTTQCTKQRAGMFWYNWKDNVEELDDQRLLKVIGTFHDNSVHMERLKALCKRVFLRRFVTKHYPHLLCGT